MVFLCFVVQCVSRGRDPLLFTSLFPPDTPGCFQCDLPPFPDPDMVRWMQGTLIAALIWYTTSIVAFIAAMRVGR
jgi:hypothetical protein